MSNFNTIMIATVKELIDTHKKQIKALEERLEVLKSNSTLSQEMYQDSLNIPCQKQLYAKALKDTFIETQATKSMIKYHERKIRKLENN